MKFYEKMPNGVLPGPGLAQIATRGNGETQGHPHQVGLDRGKITHELLQGPVTITKKIVMLHGKDGFLKQSIEGKIEHIARITSHKYRIVLVSGNRHLEKIANRQ